MIAAAVKRAVVVVTTAAAAMSVVVVVAAAAVREYQATRIRLTPVDRRHVDWPAVGDGCHERVATATVEVEQAQATAEERQAVDLTQVGAVQPCVVRVEARRERKKESFRSLREQQRCVSTADQLSCLTDGHASRCMAARDLAPCWAHAARLGQAAGPMTDDDGSQAG